MMGLVTILRGFASQWAASFVIGIATIGLQISLARQLGPVTFGNYGIAASIAGILFIAQDGGFRTLLYREATHPTPGLPDHTSLFSRALGWTILISSILFLMVVGSGAIVGLIGGAVALLILTNIGRVISQYVSSVLRAENQFFDDAKWQIKNRLSVYGPMFAFTFMTNDLLVILAIGAVAQAGTLMLPTAWRLIGGPQFGWTANILRTCLTLVTIDLITALYFRSDVLVMAALGVGKDEIGIYAALTRIVEAYIFIVAPIAVIFFRSARLEFGDHRTVGRTLWLMIAAIWVPTIILLTLSIRYHDSMIQLIFGDQYRSGAVYLPWLIAACCSAGPNALLGQMLLASNREGYFLAAVSGALAINVVLNLVLIPLYGATGAAQTTCATEFGLFLFLIIGSYMPFRNSAKSDV